MGSDLISRKAVMSHIESEYREWGGDYDAEQILGDIEDFPAACNVKKVIGTLEERKKLLLKDFVLADKAGEVKERTMARINEIDGAIEIIRSVKKAVRKNRTRPVSEMLLMMFRSSNRDRNNMEGRGERCEENKD